MRLTSVILIISISGFTLACFPEADLSKDDDVLFEEYKSKCRPNGYASEDETPYKVNFKTNLAVIRQWNVRFTEQGLPAPHGLNVFADWSKEQFELRQIIISGARGVLNNKLHILDAGLENNLFCLESDITTFDRNFTWQDLPCMSSLKWQGNCASDYAFAVTDNIADNYCIASGEYCELSAQQLIDCSLQDGCRGGFKPGSFDYLSGITSSRFGVVHKGVMRRDQYEYNGEQSKTCSFQQDKAIHQDIGGIQYLTVAESSIKKAIDNGRTVIVTVDVRNWQYITGDVIIGEGHPTECCRSDENKYVSIVGYGVDGLRGTPYWIIKNTWGYGWGNKGYAKLIAGKNCYQLRRKAAVILKTQSGECARVGGPMVKYPDEGSEDLPPLPYTTSPPQSDYTAPSFDLPQLGCTKQCGKPRKWRLIWKIIDSLQLLVDANELVDAEELQCNLLNNTPVTGPLI